MSEEEQNMKQKMNAFITALCQKDYFEDYLNPS